MNKFGAFASAMLVGMTVAYDEMETSRVISTCYYGEDCWVTTPTGPVSDPADMTRFNELKAAASKSFDYLTWISIEAIRNNN